MDKYEFNIKLEQIKKLVNKGDFETAMKIADTIDWRRVRNANLLSMIASVYEKNEEYQEAKDILLIAFERAPIGKRLLYKLTQLALKQGNIQEAENYYREFCELAGDDSRQDILRYLILKAKGAPIEQLIHSLESYTSTELDEKWLYELADLYHQAGMADQCVKTCDKIMLMFGLGQYVDKAMELKLQYAPLTKYQMDLVENRDKYEAKLRQVEENSTESGYLPSEEEESPQEKQALKARIEAAESKITGAPYQQPVQEMAPEGVSGYAPVRTKTEPTPIPVPAPSPEMLRPGAVKKPEAAAAVQPQHPTDSELKPADFARHASPAAAPGKAGDQVVPSGVQQPASEGGVTGYSSQPAFRQETVPSGTEVTAEEKLVASVKEAEVEASLAEEMSKLSMEGYAEEPQKAQTRVLNDVKDLKNTEALADKTRILDDIRHIQAVRQAEEQSPVQGTGQVQPATFCHMMAEARTPEKGLEIAVEALKAAHRILGEKHPVAKITGERLNQRGVLASAGKLSGKDLIVENAGDLTDEMLEELNQLLAGDQSGMTAVLIDNARQIDGIRKANPSLAGKFQIVESLEDAEAFLEKVAEKKNRQKAAVSAAPAQAPVAPAAASDIPKEEPAPSKTRVEVPEIAQIDQLLYQDASRPMGPGMVQPKEDSSSDNSSQESSAPASVQNDENRVMDIDEFAQYCCHYASQIDCSITGKSMLALYERIEMMEEDGVALTKTAAEDLIEEAADKAEKPSLGKRITGLFSSKYDKDGLLILKEEHFI